MLAQPPIFAPVQPVVFPPPSTSAEANPAPLPVPAGASTARGVTRQTSGPHRHARAARDALQLVRRLADQVTEPSGGGSGPSGGEQGIIANLESHGWIYQETTHGVRIFHSASQDQDLSLSNPAPLDQSTRSQAFSPTRSTASAGAGPSRGPGGAAPASRGLRADEALPFFRGEGWIEGSWRREDVAATILSLGARAVWDPRMDASRSQIVQHLSETDSLSHLSIKGNLVAPRDACLLSTTATDDRAGKDNVTYVIGTSVDDPLVPRTGQRTTIHVNGFALRSLPHPPDFEPPASVSPRGDASPPVRPSHRRTRSTVSIMQSSSALLATVPLPPVPGADLELGSPPQPAQRPQLYGSATHIGSFKAPPPVPSPHLMHTNSFYTSASSSFNASPSAAPGELPGPYPRIPFRPPTLNTLLQPKRPSISRPLFHGPGLGVSMVVRASAGMNLPQTTVNQLSVLLPLNIAAVGRFLSTHGFAPHVVRTCPGVKIREEEFDAPAGRYKAIFTVASESQAKTESEARIRFFGGTFGRGKFQIEVSHVEPDGWRLDFDVPPGPTQDGRLDMYKESDKTDDPDSRQWTSRLIVTLRGGNDEADARQRDRRTSLSSLLSPAEGDSSSRDPALQPGPLGGCTIVISTATTTPGLPIIVSITRSASDSVTIPLARMRGMSTALAQASQVALDDHYSLCDSVEDLLACMTEGEARAEMCLKGARIVLQELDEVRERQAAATAVAAAAAELAKRGRRDSVESEARLRRDGSSSRRGSADAFSASAPFAIPRRIRPPSFDA